MARAKTAVRGRAPLARDSQQWMLDYLIQETGKVFHFQGEGRGRLPRSVRSHDMISKHLGLQARRMEALAKAEADAGHPETALDFYFQATALYGGAQHIIFASLPQSDLCPVGFLSARLRQPQGSLAASILQRRPSARYARVLIRRAGTS